LSWQVFKSGQLVTIDDYSQWELRNRAFKKYNFHAAAVIPILVGEQCIGVLCVTRTRPNYKFTEEDLLAATRLADVAALALENSRMYREIEELAMTDELTGVHSRRSLMDLGEREVERARRYQRPLSALMLDMDHFKNLNDKWGHLVGDVVLRGVAQQCAELIRRTDLLGHYRRQNAEAGNIIGRFGGEEFVIFMPETALEHALIVAERIRTCIEGLSFAVPYEKGEALIQVTISLGVVSLNPAANTLLELLSRADQALYMAKQTGRNRICFQEQNHTKALG
jgi:diguanylate cyclase (GGDEF)-like protein